MTVTLMYLGASTLALALVSILYAVEDARGERVVLSGVRRKLDRILRYLINLSYLFAMWVWNGLVRLVLRYGVYQMIGALVTYLINLERRIEQKIFRHRDIDVTERSDRPRNHLDEIAEHKESIALSDEEKRRLRDE